MDTIFLKEFLVLAEYKNYSSAAFELNTTASTLYKHIQTLEDELGEKLFVKGKKKTELNDFGKILVPYAKKMVSACDDLSADFARRRDSISNSVAIGTEYLTTDLIRAFRSTDPAIKVTSTSIGVEDALEKNNLDLALGLNYPNPNNKYHSVPYIHDRLAVVLNRNHPLSQRESVTFDDLKNEDVVSVESSDSKYRLFIMAANNANYNPNITSSGRIGIGIAKMVEENLGIAFLLAHTVTKMGRDVAVVRLEPEVPADIRIYWKKDVPLAAPAQKFLDFAAHYNDDDTLNP